jgi:hypothetical protein
MNSSFVRTILVWLILAAALVIAVLVYRSHASRSRFNVEPHAAEEIEKAKRR